MRKNKDTEAALSLMKKAMTLLDKADERGGVAVHLQAAIDEAEDKTDEERRAYAVALEARLFPPAEN